MTVVTDAGKVTTIRWGMDRPRRAMVYAALALTVSAALLVFMLLALHRGAWGTAVTLGAFALVIAWFTYDAESAATVITLDRDHRTLTFDRVYFRRTESTVFNFDRISKIELTHQDYDEGDATWCAELTPVNSEAIPLIVRTKNKRDAERIVTTIRDTLDGTSALRLQ